MLHGRQAWRIAAILSQFQPDAVSPLTPGIALKAVLAGTADIANGIAVE
jgi:hypothetical protein